MTSIGVVVARFQIPDLHDGHRYLIDTVKAKHGIVLVVLGCNETRLTKRNPLDFETRKRMLQSVYPEILVMSLNDHPSDACWSANLDALIDTVLSEAGLGGRACLYGSRDSFLRVYSGRHEAVEIPPKGNISGTTIRDDLGRVPRDSSDFRAGVIYAAHQKYPTSFQVVDIAVYKPDCRKVLLVKKSRYGDDLWFPGGFVDPSDESLEMAAKRELREELGAFETAGMRYVASARIHDWRYRGEEDAILTAFFTTSYVFGRIEPNDDVDGAVWVEHAALESVIHSDHKKLVALFRESTRWKRTEPVTPTTLERSAP